MTSPNLEQVKNTEHNWRKYGEQWKMSSDARISSTWRHRKSTLVAESAESEDAPPELSPVRSYGQGFQLR
jgi:hypothetical protein